MKIFNWMHRKFNLRDEYGRNVKKDELIVRDTDTEALLENVAIADIIDGWRGGLLTIGTLGFEPLKKFIEHGEEYQFSDENGGESEDDDDDDDDYSAKDDEYCWNNEIKAGELDPLVCPTFTHILEGSNHEKLAEKAQDMMIVNIHGNPLSASNDFASNNMDGTCDGKSKKRERITLADLFSADKDDQRTKPNQPKDQLEWSENNKKLKASSQAKHGLSFAKKFIPRVSDDSRPIHKLHQLMTRMLKRKVHPDIEGKNHKTNQTKPSMLGLLSNKHGGDSVSLLQTQDIEI